MTRIAIYPGSFDPVTRGHEDLIRRSLAFADQTIVAIATNVTKDPLFTVDERLAMLRTVLAGEPRATVATFESLLAEFAQRERATVIVRGLRAVSDFEYEFQMALMNRRLAPGIETVFLMPALEFAFLSSSLVREVARFGGGLEGLVHPVVHEALARKFSR